MKRMRYCISLVLIFTLRMMFISKRRVGMLVHNDCYLGYTKRNLTPSIETLVTLTAYYDSTRECAMI